MKTPYRITKRKGRTFYQVSFAHIPNRWFSTGCTTMAGAIKFAEAKMNETTKKKEDITLYEFAQDFFGPTDPHGYKHRLERRNTFYEQSYYEQHASRLRKYILPAHGAYRLSSIKDTMIEDFILDIPSLADSSKNKVLACYRIVLQEAVREGYIGHNPANDVKEIPVTYQKRDVFTAPEIALLFPQGDEECIKLWGSLKWATYFAILKDTGWRPSEVAGLCKINYFPELRGIYTTQSVDYRTHQIKQSIKTTRKGQPFKEGFLSEQTDRLLRMLIASTFSDELFHLSDKGKNGSYIYPECANDKLRRVADKAGVALHSRTQYCFRHTFNTNALGNLPEVARLLLMGHTHNRQEYNHLTPEQALKRVLSIEGVKEALDL